MERDDHWERLRCWERLKAKGEGWNRGWDGWMASPIHRTWVQASSRTWWRTGKPGLLQSMELQRIRHHWVTGKHQEIAGVNRQVWVNNNQGRETQEVTTNSEDWLIYWIAMGKELTVGKCPKSPKLGCEVKSLSCVRLCDPIDCSLSGSSIHRIFQARTLEWVAIGALKTQPAF